MAALCWKPVRLVATERRGVRPTPRFMSRGRRSDGYGHRGSHAVAHPRARRSDCRRSRSRPLRHRTAWRNAPHHLGHAGRGRGRDHPRRPGPRQPAGIQGARSERPDPVALHAGGHQPRSGAGVARSCPLPAGGRQGDRHPAGERRGRTAASAGRHRRRRRRFGDDPRRRRRSTDRLRRHRPRQDRVRMERPTEAGRASRRAE